MMDQEQINILEEIKHVTRVEDCYNIMEMAGHLGDEYQSLPNTLSLTFPPSWVKFHNTHRIPVCPLRRLKENAS